MKYLLICSMAFLNIEIKAKCNKIDEIREILKSKNAISKGIDHQVDTYFNSKNGRLKLREGNIENSLIYYSRENTNAKDPITYNPPR